MFSVNLRKTYNKLKTTVKKNYHKGSSLVVKRPILSFFSLLGLLFLLIIIGNILRRPKPEAKPIIQTRKVEVYKIGSAPKLALQAQVEKSGVVQITSLAGGVVQKIYVEPGTQVTKGQWLVSLASNYQGGNALSLQRQIAETQNKNVEDTYPEQSDLINRQRDLANLSETNFERLRDITSQSIDDTNTLINLNNDIINTLQSNIDSLNASPSGNANLILASKQLKSQFLSANLQLNAASRSAQYQQDTNNPPTQIAIAQKDIALKQLDIQKKALDLNREISGLQLRLAQIAEGTMFPAAPFGSTVERIFVREGQAVNPGTTLMTISATIDPPLTANVYVSKDIADKISKIEASILTIGNKTLSLYPAYVTREATQGNLYAVIYNLPQDSYGDVTDKGFINIQVPVGYPDTSAAVPYLPLDAIYQTQEESFVFVKSNGKAQSKQVILGPVYGRFVQIQSGISTGDQVILDRNVVNAENVQ